MTDSLPPSVRATGHFTVQETIALLGQMTVEAASARTRQQELEAFVNWQAQRIADLEAQMPTPADIHVVPDPPTKGATHGKERSTRARQPARKARRAG